MHCLIVNHFKRKTPEKSVNRMSLVVLDIEIYGKQYSERIRSL